MATITSDQSTSTPYPGPLDNDPLTEKELAALLAIPRWADKTPNSTAFRLPLGPDPAQGWVDITYSGARSIIPRLAADWSNKLSELGYPSVGPGITICLLVQPIAHVILHWLAFWALGCSIQVVSLSVDDDAIAMYLNKSGCQVAIHSGISDARVDKIRSGWNGTMVRLAEDEHAHQIALKYKKGQADPPLPWPEPKRPDPAIITQSSGSTGAAKLLPFSLYFLTLGLPTGENLKKGKLGIIPSDPRPFFIFSSPYWVSFNAALFNQLVAGNPIAFAHVHDIADFPSSQFIDWPRSLGAGGSVCAPRFIRDILASGSQSNITFLRSMYAIGVSGSALDEYTAGLAEKYELKLVNIFGCTELGTMMIGSQPPFAHLRLLPGVTPLVLPMSDTDPDGSRHVQLWFSPSTSPRVAHLRAKGTVSLKFEPFPGEGPHKGEPAFKMDDIFKEVRTGSQVSYVYLGRSDDLIKLAGRASWDLNASGYETEITSAITSYLASQPDAAGRWSVDAVQLFGSNRPCTALVVQLCSTGQAEIEQNMVDHLLSLAEMINKKLKLESHRRVHPRKRMLVIASEGKPYGPGAGEDTPRLLVTHKHTLQRWRNIEAFKGWLDGLDYSEP